MALTLQGNQYLPTGHVLQSSVGLEPLPSLTKHFGNVGAAAVPMFTDNVLDKRNIFVGNRAFSDGYGQHDDCISERNWGRQLFVNGKEKNFCCCLRRKIRREGQPQMPSPWVETIKRGLKITSISDSWSF